MVIVVAEPSCGVVTKTEMRARRAVAVAESELLAAPAGTRLIRSAFRISGSDQRHNVRGRLALLQQSGHGLHRWPRMGKEQLQPWAKVVLTLLSIARNSEPVLRASASALTAQL